MNTIISSQISWAVVIGLVCLLIAAFCTFYITAKRLDRIEKLLNARHTTNKDNDRASNRSGEHTNDKES